VRNPFPPAGGARRLEGNEPLVLEGEHAWFVSDGTLAVFRGADASGGGARRYCFSIEAGGAILWQPGTVARPLIAVAVEPATLVPAHMEAAVTALAAGDTDATAVLRAWLTALSTNLDEAGLARLEEPPALATPGEVARLLAAAQDLFLRGSDVVERARDERARKRFDERQRLNEVVTAETLAGLTRIGARGASEAAPSIADAPLVSVLKQVGAHCGIEIRVPASSGGTAPGLEAILDASGARARKILLKGAWWRRGGEPFLATRAADGEPVGLVPVRRPWFRGVTYRALVASGPPRDVDAALAAGLAPQAFALHPPITGAMSALAVARWALSGTGREFVMAVLAGIAVVLLGMVTPQATKILFEVAIPDADRRTLLDLGAALLAATTGALLFDLARALALLRLAASSSARLQLGVWDRLLDQSPRFFRAFTAGDLESRVGAVTQIRNTLNITTLGTLIGAVASVLNIGLLYWYSPSLTVAAVGIAAVALIVNATSSVMMRRFLVQLHDREGQLRGLVIQLIGAVPKLRTAGAEMRAFAQWGRAYGAKMHVMQRLRILNDRVRLVGVVIAPLATATLFWMAGADVFSDRPTLSVGTFVAFSVAFGTFLAGVTTLGDSAQLLLGVSAMWSRLKPILDTEPELQAQKNPPGRLTGRIRIEHATFRYRDDGPLTLDDVSIAAEPGECIALVGPSGSGKSTIVNLLLRFETPLSGAIYFDRHDLKGLDILAVRQQLGVVSQENRILAGSIFDNIASGSTATHDEAWEAARAAGIEDEIRQMPMGLHTFVSEGGTNLSGGQRQRLLIARVLLRRPAIIILDEATSALDNKSQAVVTESLNRLKVTRILIAHRMSTIRQADRIYVIEAGRVVQQGTFEVLMSQEGLFARLMKRQVA